MRIFGKAALALAAGSLALAACGDSSEKVDAAPDGVPGVTVENARLVLNAVEGNPAAGYFDLAYDGEKSVVIRAADVADAQSAMIHDYIEANGGIEMAEQPQIMLNSGDEVSLEPGGMHVMAMDVSPELKAGGTTEITLTVVGGDKISFPAEVRAAGDER